MSTPSRRGLSRTERDRYDDLLGQADAAREKAAEAIAAGSSVGAREWFAACEAALRAANLIGGGSARS